MNSSKSLVISEVRGFGQKEYDAHITLLNVIKKDDAEKLDEILDEIESFHSTDLLVMIIVYKAEKCLKLFMERIFHEEFTDSFENASNFICNGKFDYEHDNFDCINFYLNLLPRSDIDRIIKARKSNDKCLHIAELIIILDNLNAYEELCEDAYCSSEEFRFPSAKHLIDKYNCPKIKQYETQAQLKRGKY